MAETIALSKILRVYEKEKTDAQKAFNQSITLFEEVANQLYTLLKRKEDAESFYDSNVEKEVPIEKIREQMIYIERLNKQIINLQAEVNKARNVMNFKQMKLKDAHIEMKKFQSILKHREMSKKEKEKKDENLAMDEISIQQHIRS
ncbi:flagellar export protein FliJ [Virgibacillus alimentarius]|uniref:Flagellar FliJ protein n=1 Tax=Virgibacillus alimentarius TaxID=698769 RepID=A0ABS4S3Y8_9BACI|nr:MULTISPECIES: flagellar export protein FliJ [Virgibacillus]MBP2256199.1 flagellar FliJ protein [Virgibacillus alimentarius]HLR66146.1 flagellar export protein FliJ [Virgibacillus sp.]